MSFATAVMLLWSAPAAAGVAYSKADLSTVRVVALRSVDMLDLERKDRRAPRGVRVYQLAVAGGGHGSGVRIGPDGLILTAQHVIDKARVIAIQPAGSKKIYPARVVYADKEKDIAFLATKLTGPDHLPLPNKVLELQSRQTVFAIGFPLDATSEYPQSAQGIVSGVRPSGEIQLGINVNPGNSGGPILNELNELVGMIVKGANVDSGVAGIGMAVPMDWIVDAYDQHVAGQPALERATRKLNERAAGYRTLAELAVEVVQHGNMVRAIIEQIDDPDNADLKRKINTAYKAHKKSPDVMALVATYYWNESLVRFIFAEDDWNKTRRIAKKLCAKAVKLDKTVVKRWPFVGAVVGKPKGRKESPFGNNQRKAKRPERSATTKSKLKPPPGRPAGFQFGISPEEAKAACVLEGHRFKETSGRYECSGAAMETAFAQTTSLEFCEDELCRIDSRSQPSQRLSKPWLQRFAAIKRHYVSRYGKPKRVRFKLPNRCKKEILPCLKDGKAAMIYSWRWPARKLTLSMGRIDGEATIRVSHEVLGEAD